MNYFKGKTLDYSSFRIGDTAKLDILNFATPTSLIAGDILVDLDTDLACFSYIAITLM